MSYLSFSIIQTVIQWEDVPANLAHFSRKLLSVLPGTVVLLPEMFSTGYSMSNKELSEEMTGTTLQWMKEEAFKHKIILGGSLMLRDESTFYNRFIWMQPDGNFGYYDKRHLFAFAGEHQHYSPGRKRVITSVQGWRINLQICYDLRFPVWSRQQKHLDENGDEYDVLIYVASWPEKRRYAWRSLLIARAIENQSYVIGVNRIGTDGNNIVYSGDSLVVDPLGEVIVDCGAEDVIRSFTLEKQVLIDARTKFPFLKDGDNFKLM